MKGKYFGITVNVLYKLAQYSLVSNQDGIKSIVETKDLTMISLAKGAK